MDVAVLFATYMYIVTLCLCSLRDTAVQVAKKCFKDEWEEKRVEFLPVEWRTWLSLDKGTCCTFTHIFCSLAVFFIPCLLTTPPSVFTGLVGDITLHGVPMLRRMLNDSILDVMYYLSPRFKPEVCVCVCTLFIHI